MDFGIALASSTDSWKVVQRAEELGFKDAWFYDSQLLYSDVFVAMTLAAEKTSRIGLATGVLIPSNRLAPVAANAFASLNTIAPGRIKMGLGTGYTGRRTMGLKAIKLAEFRQYIEVLVGMLEGKTVDWTVEGHERKLRFLNPQFGMIDIETPIDLAISAFGPKSRQLCADFGAEWCAFGGTLDNAAGQVEQMKVTWEASGRPVSSLRAVEFVLGCVLEDGEPADSPRAKAQGGTLPAAAIHGMVEDQFAQAAGSGSEGSLEATLGKLPPSLAEAIAKYVEVYSDYPPEERYLFNHTQHLIAPRSEEEHVLSADLLREFAWVGDRDELRARVARLEEAGYTQIAIQLVPGHEDAIEEWAEVFGLS
ncbi:MAG: LLM class flavin-dependent oxidoreductase [Acidobacteriota bacterium]